MNFNDLVFRECRVAFTYASSIQDEPSCQKIWEQLLNGSQNGYAWRERDRKYELSKIQMDSPNPLDDFTIVEKFFLGKQLFQTRQYTTISRFIPKQLNLKIRVVAGSKTIEPSSITPVFSFWKEVNVITITLNMKFENLGIDDLIFFKSLKWHSREPYENTVKLEFSSDGVNSNKVSFFEMFRQLWKSVLHTTGNQAVFERIRESESVLDCIELRNYDANRLIQNRGALYGLLIGDEGYKINNDSMMDSALANSEMQFEYRKYFRYYFALTSAVSLYCGNYPKSKLEFSNGYSTCYGQVEPLTPHIALISDFAGLSDGVLLNLEVTLIRHVLLREIDDHLQEVLHKMNGSSKLALASLQEAQRVAIKRLTDIDLLAKDVLWVNARKYTNYMFGYDQLLGWISQKLLTLDRLARSEYENTIQIHIRLLTFLMFVLGLVSLLLQVIQGRGPSLSSGSEPLDTGMMVFLAVIVVVVIAGWLTNEWIKKRFRV